jgi:hypothetical protein
MRTFSTPRSVEWYTPPELVWLLQEYFEGPIPLDPCAPPHNPTQARKFYTKRQNGLRRCWNARGVYAAPPFGWEFPKWAKKIAEEAARGIPIIALLSVSSRQSTAYWHNHILGPYLNCTCTIRGKVEFWSPEIYNPSGNKFDSAFYGYNVDPYRFFGVFSRVGTCFRTSADPDPRFRRRHWWGRN